MACTRRTTRSRTTTKPSPPATKPPASRRKQPASQPEQLTSQPQPVPEPEPELESAWQLELDGRRPETQEEWDEWSRRILAEVEPAPKRKPDSQLWAEREATEGPREMPKKPFVPLWEQIASRIASQPASQQDAEWQANENKWKEWEKQIVSQQPPVPDTPILSELHRQWLREQIWQNDASQFLATLPEKPNRRNAWGGRDIQRPETCPKCWQWRGRVSSSATEQNASRHQQTTQHNRKSGDANKTSTCPACLETLEFSPLRDSLHASDIEAVEMVSTRRITRSRIKQSYAESLQYKDRNGRPRDLNDPVGGPLYEIQLAFGTPPWSYGQLWARSPYDLPGDIRLETSEEEPDPSFRKLIQVWGSCCLELEGIAEGWGMVRGERLTLGRPMI